MNVKLQMTLLFSFVFPKPVESLQSQTLNPSPIKTNSLTIMLLLRLATEELIHLFLVTIFCISYQRI